MDEQMIEQIARDAVAVEKDADHAPHAAQLIRDGKWDDATEVKFAIIGARAAHGVIAGKVAELTEALKPFAEAADWKESGYTFEVPDIAYCDVTLKDCRKARAALAPYPERRHD